MDQQSFKVHIALMLKFKLKRLFKRYRVQKTPLKKKCSWINNLWQLQAIFKVVLSKNRLAFPVFDLGIRFLKKNHLLLHTQYCQYANCVSIACTSSCTILTKSYLYAFLIITFRLIQMTSFYYYTLDNEGFFSFFLVGGRGGIQESPRLSICKHNIVRT